MSPLEWNNMLSEDQQALYRRRRCEDCNGTGEEQIPCEPGDDECEFCDGYGFIYLLRQATSVEGSK